MAQNGREIEVFGPTENRSQSADNRVWPEVVYDDSKIKGFFDSSDDRHKPILEYAYGILNRKWTVLAVFLVGIAS